MNTFFSVKRKSLYKIDLVRVCSVVNLNHPLFSQASSVHLEDSGTAPPRLLFGFSQQLEELVHEKLESSKDVYVDLLIDFAP